MVLYRAPSSSAGDVRPLAIVDGVPRSEGSAEGSVDTPAVATHLGVRYWGSFVNDAPWLGEMVTPWFVATERFFVWVAGYPSAAGNELRVEFRDPHGLNSFQTITVDPGNRWQEVAFDLPEGRPQHVRVIARDGSTAASGWFGVSDPFSRERSTIGASIDALVRGLARDIGAYQGPAMLVLSVFALWLLVQYAVLGNTVAGHGRVAWWACSWSVYVVLVVATYVAFRWPYAIDREINPDESTEIAEALKMFVDPRYWVSVDGHTHGPLVNIPLMAPAFVGCELNYSNARWIAVIMWTCITTLLSLGLSCWVGPAVARIASFPVLVGVASATGYDYVAYNGEHVVLFLLAAGCYAAIRGVMSRDQPSWLFAAGVLFGAVPFAKLQGTPMAAGAGVATVVLIIMHERGSLAVRFASPRFVMACIGGAAPSILAIVLLGLYGGLDRFWQSYIVWNLAYADRGPMDLGSAMIWVIREGSAIPAVPPLSVAGAIGLVALGSMRSGRLAAKTCRITLITCSAMFVLGLYSAARPGNPFHHYILLALAPWLCLLAVLFAILTSQTRRYGWIAVVAIVGVALVPGVQVAAARPWIPVGRDVRDTRVAQVINQYARFPQTMVVWGWMPRYHVMTGLVPAVRHNVFAKEMEYFVPDEGKRFYQSFLNEFRQSPPDVFVDAVAPGSFALESRASHGYEAFPELAALVERGYVLVDEIAGIRIFVRVSEVNN